MGALSRKAGPVLGIRTALVLSHLLVLALPVAGFIASRALGRDLLEQREEELTKEAWLVAMMVEQGPPPDLARVREATHAGVRILDAQGEVIATNGPRMGESMADQKEVQRALAGEASVAARRIPPESRVWATAVVPLKDGGAVLLTRPSRRTRDAIQDLAQDLGPAAFVAGSATLALALWSGWRLSRSLRALAQVAHDIADGHIDRPVPDDLLDTRVAQVRALARAFEAMRGRLSLRLRHNQEFASNVSHEFRTPLATLRGTVDVLAEDTDMPAAQRERFQANAHTDLDRMSRMVDGLLALARAERPGEREEVDLDALIAAVAARHAVPVEGRAGMVTGDGAQLELVLENLLLNAEEHGGAPIRVEAFAGGFEVVDAGPGISEANLPRVFERFFTKSRDRRGTGLGLAIVRAIAEAHGGGATATSRPGETRVRVWVGRAGG